MYYKCIYFRNRLVYCTVYSSMYMCMEQSAGRCHIVAITADIPETAEDRTVCSELLIGS